MQCAWLSLDDHVKRRPIRTTKFLRGPRQRSREIVTAGHANVQFRHPAASVAHHALHACSYGFQCVLGCVRFVRQLIVDHLCLEAQGGEVLDERVVELLGNPFAVGGARFELRAKAMCNLPEADAMRAPACKQQPAYGDRLKPACS